MTFDIKAEIKNRWPQIKDLIWTGVKVWIAVPLFLLIYFLAYDIFMYSNPPYGYVKLWLLVQIALFLMLQSVTFLPIKKWKLYTLAVLVVIALMMFFFNNDVRKSYNKYMQEKVLIDY